MSWYAQSRKIAAWIIIPAFLLMFISDAWIVQMNPVGRGPWPDLLPRPRAFEILLWTRNLSFLLALITGIWALPRWQALIGLTLTLALAIYSYWMFASY
jgi:hypothetical protein